MRWFVQDILLQEIFPDETLDSTVLTNAWLCALALACQMANVRGVTRRSTAQRSRMHYGGEPTVAQDKSGILFLSIADGDDKDLMGIDNSQLRQAPPLKKF